MGKHEHSGDRGHGCLAGGRQQATVGEQAGTVLYNSVVAVGCCCPSVVSVSVRSLTAHMATHSTHRACVGHRACEVIGSEYGEDVAAAGGAKRKKTRVGLSDVTTPPPPLDE